MCPQLRVRGPHQFPKYDNGIQYLNFTASKSTDNLIVTCIEWSHGNSLHVCTIIIIIAMQTAIRNLLFVINVIASKAMYTKTNREADDVQSCH